MLKDLVTKRIWKKVSSVSGFCFSGTKSQSQNYFRLWCVLYASKNLCLYICFHLQVENSAKPSPKKKLMWKVILIFLFFLILLSGKQDHEELLAARKRISSLEKLLQKKWSLTRPESSRSMKLFDRCSFIIKHFWYFSFVNDLWAFLNEGAIDFIWLRPVCFDFVWPGIKVALVD